MRLNQKKSPWGKAAGSLFALLLALMPMLTSVYTTHVISVAMISYLCVLSVYVLLGLGTRLFVTGNKDKPHLVHWSEVNNPLYFTKDNAF